MGFLDIAERLLALALYGWLIARVMTVYLASGGAGNLIVLYRKVWLLFSFSSAAEQRMFLGDRRIGCSRSSRPRRRFWFSPWPITWFCRQRLARHDAGRHRDSADRQTNARPQFRLGTGPSRPEALRALSISSAIRCTPAICFATSRSC